jgi:hypothetical protein
MDWAKSPVAILPDIGFVAASKRRDFCSLGTAGLPPRFRRASASFAAGERRDFRRLRGNLAALAATAPAEERCDGPAE